MSATEIYDSLDNNKNFELIEQIISRIDQLPDKCSDVMRLCFLECKKYKEIAEELNISVNTVKTQITNGLKILRNEFPDTLLLLFNFRVVNKMKLNKN